MHIEGDDARDPGSYALAQLKAILEAGFAAAPWAGRLNDWGGVGVVTDDTEAVGHVRSKRPFIYLEVAALDADDTVNWRKMVLGTLKNGTRWMLEISAEVVCGDANSPIENTVCAALMSIVQTNYATLRDLGIEGSEIKAGQGKSQLPDRIKPHTISCAIHALDP